jgi:hypothetical protein
VGPVMKQAPHVTLVVPLATARAAR